MNWLKLLILSAGTFLMSCGGGSATNPEANKANLATPSTANNRTRDLYVKNCSGCHQPDGEGGTVKLEDQKLKVPSFKSDRVRRHSDNSMIDQILKGGEGMPAFRDKLNQEEINDLVRFIHEELQANTRTSQN